ncbi:MAG: hypothetical protein WC521_06495 [Bdellovibrionales bacterium]
MGLFSEIAADLVSDCLAKIRKPKVPLSEIKIIHAGDQTYKSDHGSVFTHLCAIKGENGLWTIKFLTEASVGYNKHLESPFENFEGLTGEEAVNKLLSIAGDLEPKSYNEHKVVFVPVKTDSNDGTEICLINAKKRLDWGEKFNDPAPQKRNNQQTSAKPAVKLSAAR